MLLSLRFGTWVDQAYSMLLQQTAGDSSDSRNKAQPAVAVGWKTSRHRAELDMQ
jgi:hypothetical protein